MQTITPRLNFKPSINDFPPFVPFDCSCSAGYGTCHQQPTFQLQRTRVRIAHDTAVIDLFNRKSLTVYKSHFPRPFVRSIIIDALPPSPPSSPTLGVLRTPRKKASHKNGKPYDRPSKDNIQRFSPTSSDCDSANTALSSSSKTVLSLRSSPSGSGSERSLKQGLLQAGLAEAKRNKTDNASHLGPFEGMTQRTWTEPERAAAIAALAQFNEAWPTLDPTNSSSDDQVPMWQHIHMTIREDWPSRYSELPKEQRSKHQSVWNRTLEGLETFATKQGLRKSSAQLKATPPPRPQSVEESRKREELQLQQLATLRQRSRAFGGE